MKKVLILGAIIFSSLSFASNSLNNKTVKEKENEKKENLLKFLLRYGIWSVTFQTSCGTTTNVAFESNYEDGTPEFIQDLADAVNWADSICDE